jgi:hypothetical protein
MAKIKNKKLFVTIVSLIVVATLSVLFFGYWVMYSVIDYLTFETYVTTNINEYGKFQGTHQDDEVEEMVMSFFPSEISQNFEDVKYTYKAERAIASGFEAYLEFTIEDSEKYAEFVDEYTEGIEGVTSPYDEAYTEYIIEDYFVLLYSDDEVVDGMIVDSEGREDDYSIRFADVRKIICCPDEQRIIFVAIGVFESGGTDAKFLCTYFNRFDINPREYAHGREW